jgi:poly-gamma-glutamate capsule biosynthesis protein CapA/YwtB (metallophosphatase superfamily)
MKLITTLLTLLLIPVVASTEPLVIHAVGDIMLAGSGDTTYRKLGYDYPFAATRDILRQSDIAIGNLEAPLTSSGVEFTDKKFRFKTEPKAAAALKNAGFTHLSLANNHILDFGAEGLRQTLAALDANAIIYSGAGLNLALARKSGMVEVKGVKVAFLSYSLTYPEEFFAGAEKAGTTPGYASVFTADITQAKKSADCVIVSFHWGGEGEDRPKPYQVSAAHKAVDAGADIIIGHHPHVLQGVEQYNNGVIFYSLGNFAFGSNSRSSAVSMIARITFDNGIKAVEVIPLNVLNTHVHYQPKILKGAAASDVVKKIDHLSSGLNNQIAEEVNGRYLIFSRPGEIALK